jgi:hypothetical protein
MRPILALENAGYNSESYNGKIGLYAGVTTSNYFLTNLYSNQDLLQSVDALNISIGKLFSAAATCKQFSPNLRSSRFLSSFLYHFLHYINLASTLPQTSQVYQPQS